MQCPPAPLGFGSEALKCLPGGYQCSSVPDYGTSRTLTSWPILARCHLSIRTALIAVPEARSCRRGLHVLAMSPSSCGVTSA